MNATHQRIERLFWQATQLESSTEQLAFVDKVCADDVEVHREVVALLGVRAAADEFAEAYQPTINHARVDMTGRTIGPYKIRERIGEGGMGVVYTADQKAPVRRRVALKIIKPGMDSRQVIARFASERQTLAMMDHPNIARVLEAGTTDNGLPYFVMELVNGVPITQYCDELRLSIRQRLELLIPVCRAIQHAHQKGIIHRDLKPSNILVTQYDDEPVPKVIDFGVAKAVGSQLGDYSVYTEFGQVIGTLEYMSPEQAARNQQEVDTRSDVYSLGVVLYELLSGMPPFEKRRLRSEAFDEVLKIIRHEDPPRPSFKLRTSATLPAIASSRSVDPAKLSRQVSGELDWIVMKALEKKRDRRYDSAQLLGQDLEAYLSSKPVLASPPSALYQLRKWASRHRAVASLFAASAVLLVVGLAGLAAYAVAQKELADTREAFLVEKEQQRQLAIAAQQETARRLKDSLLHEATAVRLARPLGYRSRVKTLVDEARQAHELTTEDLTLVRNEVLSFVGDAQSLPVQMVPAKEVRIHLIRLPKDYAALDPFIDPTKALPRGYCLSKNRQCYARLVDRSKRTSLEFYRGGRLEKTLDFGSEKIRDADLSRDGEQLFVVNESGLQVFDTSTWQVTQRIRDGVYDVVKLHPRLENVVLVANIRGLVEIWYLRTPKRLAQYKIPSPVSGGDWGGIPAMRTSVFFSPNGDRVIHGEHESETLRSLPVLDSPEKIAVAGHQSSVTRLAWNSSGTFLLSGSQDGRIYGSSPKWDDVFHSNESLSSVQFSLQADGEIVDLDFSDNGKYFAYGTKGGEWAIRDAKNLAQLVGRQTDQPVSGVSFGVGDQVFAVATWGEISTWRLDEQSSPVSLTPIATFRPKDLHIVGVELHPNRLEACLLKDRAAWLRHGSNKIADAGLLQIGAPEPKPIHLTDGSRLDVQYAISDTGFAEAGDGVWGIRNGQLWFVHRESDNSAEKRFDIDHWRADNVLPKSSFTSPHTQAFAIGPGGRSVALLREANQVAVIDLATRAERFSLPPESSPISTFRFNPDGTHLAVGCEDGQVFVWNLLEVEARLSEFQVGPERLLEPVAETEGEPLLPEAVQTELDRLVETAPLLRRLKARLDTATQKMTDYSEWTALTDVRFLDVSNAKAFDLEAFAKAVSLESLEEVDLSGTEATNEQLSYLLVAKQLKALNLSHTWVDEGAAETLAKMKSLERLNLDCTWFDDNALKQLARLPRLHSLSIFMADIHGDELGLLLASPTLRSVRWGGLVSGFETHQEWQNAIGWKLLKSRFQMNTWAFGIDEDERFASRRPIPSVPPGTGQVDLSDLFASTQPREGKWTQQESGWLLEKSDDSRSGLIHLPAELPDEFDLSLRVVRRFSRYENGLWIGCPWTTPNQRKTQVFVLGDLEGSGLNDFQRTSRYDHHGWRDRHRQFPIDRPVDVVIKVRAEAVSIEIDGRLVLTVEGPPSNQLSDWNQLGKFDDGIGLRAFGRFEIQHVRIQSP